VRWIGSELWVVAFSRYALSTFKEKGPKMAGVLPQRELGRWKSCVFGPEPGLLLDEQIHPVKVSVLPVGLCIELLDTQECLPVPWEEVYKAAVRRHEQNVRRERPRNSPGVRKAKVGGG
jgi:hypothetical protein